MTYTVTLQASVNVDATSYTDAINKACLEATFGTDLYGISLVDVQVDDDTQEVGGR